MQWVCASELLSHLRWWGCQAQAINCMTPRAPHCSSGLWAARCRRRSVCFWCVCVQRPPMGRHHCCQGWAKARKEQTPTSRPHHSVPSEGLMSALSSHVLFREGPASSSCDFVGRGTCYICGTDLGTMKLNWQVPQNERTNEIEKHTPTGYDQLQPEHRENFQAHSGHRYVPSSVSHLSNLLLLKYCIAEATRTVVFFSWYFNAKIKEP